MKIGIVGLGIVGTAVRAGLQILGHRIVCHDIKDNTRLSDVISTEVCFLCVPTPSKLDGSCDISIVESVVKDLDSLKYKGLITIKSTVTPGTTRNLQEQYPNLQLCFVPEFLRERCASEDFINNHDICVVGATSEESYRKILDAHGFLPKKFIRTSETEAELVKYFNNVYNATLITFANSFYELCKGLDVNYTNVKNAVVNREHINDIYLNCDEDLRGFGGMCLPKDTKNLVFLCSQLGIDVNFFENILNENDKYKVTVFDGMRKQ